MSPGQETNSTYSKNCLIRFVYLGEQLAQLGFTKCFQVLPRPHSCHLIVYRSCLEVQLREHNIYIPKGHNLALLCILGER